VDVPSWIHAGVNSSSVVVETAKNALSKLAELQTWGTRKVVAKLLGQLIQAATVRAEAEQAL
jgi:hypothetical protein